MDYDDRPPLATFKTTLRNRRRQPMKLELQPWDETAVIPPGGSVQIVAKGPAGDTVEIDQRRDVVIVYGWPGSVVSVIRDGVDLPTGRAPRKASRLTAPFLPQGIRMREWVESLR